jgi:hypothetical protein
MRRLAMVLVVLSGLLLTSNVASANHRRARVYVPAPARAPHVVYGHPYAPYAAPYHHRYIRPHNYPGRVPFYVPPYRHHHHYHHHPHWGYGGPGVSLYWGF